MPIFSKKPAMKGAAAWMTMIIIGLVLAVLVVAIFFTVGGQLAEGIFKGSQKFLCQLLPVFKC